MEEKKTTKGSPDKDCKEGEAKLNTKQYKSALIAFNRALEKNHQHLPSIEGKFKASAILGQQIFDEGDLKLAKEYYKDAHLLKPNETEIHNRLASIRHQRYLQKKSRQVPQVELEAMTKSQKRVDNIVLEGGGIKGVAYLGAFRKLPKYIDMTKVIRYGAASAGSIFAALLALDYSIDEFENIMKKTNFTHFMDGPYREDLLRLNKNQDELLKLGQGIFADINKIKNASRKPFTASGAASRLGKASKHPDIIAVKKGFGLLKNGDLGLFPGDYFREQWLEPRIQAKTGIAYATFAELKQLREEQPEKFGRLKQLYIVGVNLSTGLIEVFSEETTPDMIVSDAVRISMSIPVVFKPHQIYYKINGLRVADEKGHLYVDGGMLDNYPMWLFNKAKFVDPKYGDSERVMHNPYTLGMRLVAPELQAQYQTNADPLAREKPDNLPGFLWQLVETIYRKQESDHRKMLESANTIYINDLKIGTAQFDLNEKEIQDLIKKGSKGVKAYFSGSKEENKQMTSDNEILPLHEAVEINDSRTVTLLLAQGINSNTITQQGVSALDIAEDQDNKPMILLLVQWGAYVCQHPLRIQHILEAALSNEFVDAQALKPAYEHFMLSHQSNHPESNSKEKEKIKEEDSSAVISFSLGGM
jgi:NTE family protein